VHPQALPEVWARASSDWKVGALRCASFSGSISASSFGTMAFTRVLYASTTELSAAVSMCRVISRLSSAAPVASPLMKRPTDFAPSLISWHDSAWG
jgi:hypothetical protein